MSSTERKIKTNVESDPTVSLINFLSPRPYEKIILGQVTRSRARNSRFTVELIKQESIGDIVRVVGNQAVTEKLLKSTAECLKPIATINIIQEDEKARLTLIRDKILEITKEAKSKIK